MEITVLYIVWSLIMLVRKIAFKKIMPKPIDQPPPSFWVFPHDEFHTDEIV